MGFNAALKLNMLTMCHKVTVSLTLFTLNSEFYIYCVRINRFEAWPISAPAYFSPCEKCTTKVVLEMFVIRRWLQKKNTDFYNSSYLANLRAKTQLGISDKHPAAGLMLTCCFCLSVSLSVSLLVCLPADTFLSTQYLRNGMWQKLDTYFCHML